MAGWGSDWGRAAEVGAGLSAMLEAGGDRMGCTRGVRMGEEGVGLAGGVREGRMTGLGDMCTAGGVIAGRRAGVGDEMAGRMGGVGELWTGGVAGGRAGGVTGEQAGGVCGGGCGGSWSGNCIVPPPGDALCCGRGLIVQGSLEAGLSA